MTTVSAYAAASATEPWTRTTIERRDLGPRDVAIAIKFCGICYSDSHIVAANWAGPSVLWCPDMRLAAWSRESAQMVIKHIEMIEPHYWTTH